MSMSALVFAEKNATLTQVSRPAPKQEEALIRVSLAGICATDREIMRGYAGFHGILGHEFVGMVTAAADPSWVGCRVVADINCPCLRCPTCQRGDSIHCPQRTVLGIHGRDGCFADYCVLPILNLHKVPDTISDRQAVFAEPLAAALAILQRYHICPEERVAIVGDGKLGLLVAQVLALTGCELTVVGRHPQKWRVLEQRGIQACLAADWPKDRWVDTVVECSGNRDGMNLASQLLRPRGRIILKSTFHAHIDLNLSAMVVDEIALLGSRCGPFLPALRLLERQLVDVEALIAACYPLANGLEALALAAQSGVLKVLVQPGA